MNEFKFGAVVQVTKPGFYFGAEGSLKLEQSLAANDTEVYYDVLLTGSGITATVSFAASELKIIA